MSNQKFWVGYNKNDAIRNGKNFSTFNDAVDYAKDHRCGSVWVAPAVDFNIEDLEYVDYIENDLLPKIRKARG